MTVFEIAEKAGTDIIKEETPWKGYRVYSIYSTFMIGGHYGYPKYVLERSDEVRKAATGEVQTIMYAQTEQGKIAEMITKTLEQEVDAISVDSVWELPGAYIAYPVNKAIGEFSSDKAWLILKENKQVLAINDTGTLRQEAVMIWERKENHLSYLRSRGRWRKYVMSRTVFELVLELQKVCHDGDFLAGILDFVDNEEDQQKLMKFIRKKKNADAEAVSDFAIELSNRRIEQSIYRAGSIL